MIKKISLLILIVLITVLAINRNIFIRLYQDYQSLKLSKNRAEIYRLEGKTNIKDITEQLISDKNTPSELKESLIKGERKIVVFKYLSDNNKVAGYLSYLTNHKQNPTLIFLRGGNKFFGIMRPNNRFSFLKRFNIVGTLYRGNIYGGKDEFGGDDVNDVENLIKFLPQLEQYSKIKLQPPFSMMGVSRGAMEMFLSLNRSEYVQKVINKAISVSGNLDLHVSMQHRPDMEYLFKRFFKDSPDKDFADWIHARNPINNLTNIPKALQVLLVYGLADNRVSLQEQLNFKQALEKENIDYRLVTFAGVDHGFDNDYNTLEKEVLKFLESDGK
ncbi:MAG: prolyl oligopeptidase family serine peptidase [Legionella sp.]|nr:prolyl oligopeptidase family serine peptidase [Legionella sp.]